MEEPTYIIHLNFENGSNPYIVYNLTLKKACKELEKWNKNWILVPETYSRLDGIWYFSATERRTIK